MKAHVAQAGSLWERWREPRWSGAVLTLAAALLSACATPPHADSSELAAATVAPHAGEDRVRQLQQAEALYLAGRLAEAQAAFEQLAQQLPRNGEVWFRLGNTLLREGRYDDAATALLNAVSLDTGNGRAALNLSLARLAQAQAALATAQSRLAADSAERSQADQLQRQLAPLLGAPAGAAH